MKLSLIVFLTLILLLPITVGCTSEPPPDVPRYTADQVIAVAQAKYPVGYGTETERVIRPGTEDWAMPQYEFKSKRIETPTSVSVNYIGDGRWEVTISLPSRYHFKDEAYVNSKTLYFDEATGQIR